MSQTTAPKITMDQAFAGMLADGPQPKDIISKSNAAAMLMGYYAARDGVDGAKAPAAAGDVAAETALGIVLHSHALESARDAADASWPAESALPILRKGRAWVVVEDAVTAGQPAFAVHTGGDEGIWRSDVDGGNAVQVPTAYFQSSTSGAGLAIVEINLP